MHYEENPTTGIAACCARAASGQAAAAPPMSVMNSIAFWPPASQGRIAEYRIGGGQSGGNQSVCIICQPFANPLPGRVANIGILVGPDLSFIRPRMDVPFWSDQVGAMQWHGKN